MNWYGVPFVSSSIEQLRVFVVHVRLSGVDVTLYSVILEPPSLDGCCHVIVACPAVAVACTVSGGLGGLDGITGGEESLEMLTFPPV